MKRSLVKTASAAAISLAVVGCATTSVSTFDPFQAEDLNTPLNSGLLEQKVDNLYVIVDSSSSMSKDYKGEGYPGSPDPTKFAVEKEILSRMNQTIPGITANTAIRTFGWGSCQSYKSTVLRESLGSYSTSAFASGLDTLSCSSGGTPLGAALEAASADLSTVSGRSAILILSDGHDLDDSPVPAAQGLASQLGDNICIYSVWVGNENEAGGRATLQSLSNVVGCGYATSAATVASAAGMAGFVESMLFVPLEPQQLVAVENDSDGDGVPDDMDQCPNTPTGAIVDETGCWAYHGVFFDFDSATIKPEFTAMFDNAVKVMNVNPGLTVEIQGHTDSIGTEAYNLKLSERRAQAVFDYMVAAGIDPARMTVKGYGESDPAASNDTEEGRAFNRRVYFERTDD